MFLTSKKKELNLEILVEYTNNCFTDSHTITGFNRVVMFFETPRFLWWSKVGIINWMVPEINFGTTFNFILSNNFNFAC